MEVSFIPVPEPKAVYNIIVIIEKRFIGLQKCPFAAKTIFMYKLSEESNGNRNV